MCTRILLAACCSLRLHCALSEEPACLGGEAGASVHDEGPQLLAAGRAEALMKFLAT